MSDIEDDRSKEYTRNVMDIFTGIFAGIGLMIILLMLTVIFVDAKHECILVSSNTAVYTAYGNSSTVDLIKTFAFGDAVRMTDVKVGYPDGSVEDFDEITQELYAGQLYGCMTLNDPVIE